MEDKIRVLVPQEDVEKRIREMAEEISRDYKGETLHLVCILRGSIFSPVSLPSTLLCRLPLILCLCPVMEMEWKVPEALKL